MLLTHLLNVFQYTFSCSKSPRRATFVGGASRYGVRRWRRADEFSAAAAASTYRRRAGAARIS